jgi:hypothetical protein
MHTMLIVMHFTLIDTDLNTNLKTGDKVMTGAPQGTFGQMSQQRQALRADWRS